MEWKILSKIDEWIDERIGKIGKDIEDDEKGENKKSWENDERIVEGLEWIDEKK